MKELELTYKKNKKNIQNRLKEFKEISENEWFYELLFCLLTPQSNAKKCWQAVLELKQNNFQDIENTLKTKTRFYRNKSKYIREAIGKWQEIKSAIHTKSPANLREYLIENVKGIGMKEASHFIRNIGKNNSELAILDRHILRNLQRQKAITEIKSLNKKTYLQIESQMKSFSKKIEIPLDELDLLFWQNETGEIFK